MGRRGRGGLWRLALEDPPPSLRRAQSDLLSALFFSRREGLVPGRSAHLFVTLPRGNSRSSCCWRGWLDRGLAAWLFF